MFDVYWSDQPQKTVGDCKEQAPTHKKERAPQRPLSRPSFFKQLSGKRQDGGQMSKRGSSTLSMRSSNKSTQGTSIASSDDYLPAQELPAYSHEPQELPATEIRIAPSLRDSVNLGNKGGDGQLHSPSTESLASSAGWLINSDTSNSRSPTSPMISTSRRESQSGYNGVLSPIQHSIPRKPTGPDTIRREQSLQRPRAVESSMVLASCSTTSQVPRCSNPNIAASLPTPDIQTTQKTVSKSAFPTPHQERQSDIVAQIQNYGEEQEVGAIGLPEEPPSHKLLPTIASSDVGVPSSFRLPVSTSSSKVQVVETSLEHLATSRRKIKYMESASQKVTLQRLQEVWDNNVNDVFQEVEAEKEWWLYMSYEKLRRIVGQTSASPRALEGEISPDSGTEGHNVLFLYHNQLAVDFLTIFTSTTQFYHLFPPAFDTRAPKLPLPSQTFRLIHLPITVSSLLPASSLPLLLQECARVLCPKLSPSLHLTILDSYPLPETMGPLLQHWLTTNLLLNLEINFRCLSPRRLIPLWLEKAGLRVVEGNSLVRRFLGTRTNLPNEVVEAGDKVAMELEVEVGQRLWWMVWGRFVQGGVRWWDDEEIVKECERMGTIWEVLEIKSTLL